MKKLKQNEMKVALLRKTFAVLGSLAWFVFATVVIATGIRDKNTPEILLGIFLGLGLGLLFLRVCISYVRSIECVPLLGTYFTKKELGEMLENEEFSPLTSRNSMDSSDSTGILVSPNWLDIGGYLYNRAMIAGISRGSESPDTYYMRYIDSSFDTKISKTLKKHSGAYNALRNLGIKDVNEYALDPKYEDIEDMIEKAFVRATDDKEFNELKEAGMSLQDIRNKWEAEMKRT